MAATNPQKPAEKPGKPAGPLPLFKPGKELAQQDWKLHKLTGIWSAPGQDVQTFETEDQTVLIVSHDKIIGFVPPAARPTLDLFEIVPPKVPGPQTEVSIVAFRKNPDADPARASTMQVYKISRKAVLECIDKAETAMFDEPHMLSPEIANIGLGSGHDIGFNITLNTVMPRSKPDIILFHDLSGIHVQKMHRLNPYSGYSIGQFEGFYYRFYDLNKQKWTDIGFNMDIDTGYINKALLIGTPEDGYLLTSCGRKFLLIKLGATCSIFKTIIVENLKGEKCPADFFPIVSYAKIFKGKYLVSVVDQTNLWILPLASDAKSIQGKHYDLKGPVDPKAQPNDESKTDFIRWDSKPGHVVLVADGKYVLKKLDKLEVDFPEFNTSITEQDFDTKMPIKFPESKPELVLKSKAPQKASAESPSLSEHPYKELIPDLGKHETNEQPHQAIEETQQMHSTSNMNFRSTMSKSQHKLTWSAPNPYAQQYAQKPVHAYEEEEAQILSSPEYRKKLKVQAAKKESFQLFGFQHPPKKTYNSLVDQHLSMFLSKPEVHRHLLKQKLVDYLIILGDPRRRDCQEPRSIVETPIAEEAKEAHQEGARKRFVCPSVFFEVGIEHSPATIEPD